MNLKPVFSSGKLPQLEDTALAKLPGKVVLKFVRSKTDVKVTSSDKSGGLNTHS